MFLLEFDHDEVKKEASKLLKSLGVKHRLKKFEIKGIVNKETFGVFKVRLEKLQKRKVKLPQYEQPVNVPGFLVDACDFLRGRIGTDGIFRKPGLATRQKEIKLLVNGGQRISNCELNVSDVADLLKLFFRELPEPCIPYAFHDVLQKCFESKARHKDAILVATLLLPMDYLVSLAYLMQFLQEVAAHHQSNRMDTSNLSIVWTPNLMPFKTGQVDDKNVIGKRLSIVQVLIENANQIGVVPECLYEHLSSYTTPYSSITSHDELEISKNKKKKRRSGSLTRMLSGIRKMVRRSNSQEHLATPDQPIAFEHTPRIITTGKKRKASEANQLSQSAKKRRDLLESLPQKTLLPDVCVTYLTPRVLVAQPLTTNHHMEEAEPKRRSRFYTHRTPERIKERKSCRTLSGTKLRLSHFGLSKKQRKKDTMAENSYNELSATPNNLDITSNSEDYVRISRSEYEDIKNRVSNIESRISSEFENIIGVSMSDLENTPNKSVVDSLRTVQSVYERTLESAEKLNGSASDELARRLSKELKIRDSLEKKVMRSPSARKIGSLRRRSKENCPLIKRNLSLNVPEKWTSRQFYPINGLRRGKPNTVHNGLPETIMVVTDKTEGQIKNFSNQLHSETLEYQMFEPSDVDLSNFGILTRSQARRASSFHGCDLSKGPTTVLTHLKNNNNLPVDVTSWKSADDFLDEEKAEEKPVTGRPSLAQIRSQNAGMVLAKTKLFDTMVDAGDKVEMRVFKNVKTNREKSQGIKKRNSSKSSKERKLQKTDSKNGECIQKKEQPNCKQSTDSNTPKKSETCFVSKKEKINGNFGKENMPKTHVRTLQSTIHKTPSHSSKTTHSSFTSAKQSKRVMSPFRENYRNVSSLQSSSSRQTVNRNVPVGGSPNVAHHILSKSRASPMKTNSSTPRRSPRTHMLKSQHINKQQ